MISFLNRGFGAAMHAVVDCFAEPASGASAVHVVACLAGLPDYGLYALTAPEGDEEGALSPEIEGYRELGTTTPSLSLFLFSGWAVCSVSVDSDASSRPYSLHNRGESSACRGRHRFGSGQQLILRPPYPSRAGWGHRRCH
jgi:hypothetical protein